MSSDHADQMKGIAILRAGAELADEISLVHIKSWRAAYAGIVPQDYLDALSPEKRAAAFRKNVAERPEEFYAVRLDGRTVGLLILGRARDEDAVCETGSIGEICALYLDPAFWGQGLGKQLMAFGLDRLCMLGFSQAILWVLRDNARARRFYERCGFLWDGGEKDIQIGRPLREIRYRLRLGSDPGGGEKK